MQIRSVHRVSLHVTLFDPLWGCFSNRSSQTIRANFQVLANNAFLIPHEVISWFRYLWHLKRKRISGRGWGGCANKCASENMNMKMYSDPAIELFSSTLMSAATPVTLPKAAQVFLPLFVMVWNVSEETRSFSTLTLHCIAQILIQRGYKYRKI